MWILKFTMSDPEGTFSRRNKKFKIKTYAYRTNHYYKDNNTIVSGIILAEGKDKNIKDFVKSLKKDTFEKGIKKKDVKSLALHLSTAQPDSITNIMRKSENIGIVRA